MFRSVALTFRGGKGQKMLGAGLPRISLQILGLSAWNKSRHRGQRLLCRRERTEVRLFPHNGVGKPNWRPSLLWGAWLTRLSNTTPHRHRVTRNLPLFAFLLVVKGPFYGQKNPTDNRVQGHLQHSSISPPLCLRKGKKKNLKSVSSMHCMYLDAAHELPDAPIGETIHSPLTI